MNALDVVGTGYEKLRRSLNKGADDIGSSA